MKGHPPGRRAILQATAAIFGGTSLSLSFASRSNAFSLEPLDPNSPVGLAYAGRCGGSSEHSALMARLQADLVKTPSRRSLSAVCPICGCPVVASLN
jgi:hypothetical protein